jgi:hypothetical protein
VIKFQLEIFNKLGGFLDLNAISTLKKQKKLHKSHHSGDMKKLKNKALFSKRDIKIASQSHHFFTSKNIHVQHMQRSLKYILLQAIKEDLVVYRQLRMQKKTMWQQLLIP